MPFLSLRLAVQGMDRRLVASLLLAAWSSAAPAAGADGARGSAKPPAKCPVSEKMLIGAWKNESGGFFEEMAFEASGSSREFNSWLHSRPEILGGSWKLENCTLHIRHSTQEAMSFAFTYVRVRGGRLYLREAGEKASAVYTRIKP